MQNKTQNIKWPWTVLCAKPLRWYPFPSIPYKLTHLKRLLQILCPYYDPAPKEASIQEVLINLKAPGKTEIKIKTPSNNKEEGDFLLYLYGLKTDSQQPTLEALILKREDFTWEKGQGTWRGQQESMFHTGIVLKCLTTGREASLLFSP